MQVYTCCWVSNSVIWEEMSVIIMIFKDLGILIRSVCLQMLEFVALVILLGLVLILIQLVCSACLKLFDKLENPELEMREKIISACKFAIIFVFYAACCLLISFGLRYILGDPFIEDLRKILKKLWNYSLDLMTNHKFFS